MPACGRGAGTGMAAPLHELSWATAAWHYRLKTEATRSLQYAATAGVMGKSF
jgi:hypothetical protein